MPSLILKPARDKSLLRRHPWVFSGAVERVEGSPRSGETLDVLNANGQFVAHAWVEYNGAVTGDDPDVVERYQPLSGIEVVEFR